jgi:hypothetical protein
MNFKTLTAIGAAATVAGFLAAPQAKADPTAWIYDGYTSPGNNNGQYTDGPSGVYSHNNTYDPATGTTWYDSIGYSKFETSAISVTWGSNGDVTFTTYTNYLSYDNNAEMADWLFDLDENNVFNQYDAAVHPNIPHGSTTGGNGSYIPVGSITGIEHSSDYFGSGHNFGQTTNVCDISVSGDCDTGARASEVVALHTSNTTNINIGDGGAGTLNGNPFSDTQPSGAYSFLHSYSFTLAGVNTGGDWDSFRVFWGTGQCANDTIEGSVSNVPIPAAAWLFGSAIFGLGAVGWKRRSPAA